MRVPHGDTIASSNVPPNRSKEACRRSRAFLPNEAALKGSSPVRSSSQTSLERPLPPRSSAVLSGDADRIPGRRVTGTPPSNAKLGAWLSSPARVASIDTKKTTAV